ncbi:MAG: LUD domain-containing protein [Euryarchaeota archaeon]|nr:LUD domain-containing protein [Euryarchaeota archaeon]
MGREEVLRAVRTALGRANNGADEPPPALDDRPIPREEIPDPVARFVVELEAVAGEAIDSGTGDWQEIVRDIAAAAGLRHVVVGPDVDVDNLGLQRVTLEEAWRRPEEVLGLVRAEHAIAESGSVVLETDGVHAPSTFTASSVVLLAKADIVAALEDLPSSADARARIIVTGPSRTSDIEKRLVLGAHGPRRLVVVLTDR